MRALRSLALLFLPLSAVAQRGQHGPPPSPLAARCGTRIPWLRTLDAALAQAQTEHKPVLWYVPTVAGSPMDRKGEIDRYLRFGPFASDLVVALVTRRFVPLMLAPSGAAARERGLVPGKFIEPGFLVLDPDGSERFRVDKLTTLREEWFVRTLRGCLKEPAPPVASAPATPAARAEALWLSGDPTAALAALAEQQDAAATHLRGRILLSEHRADAARTALTAAAATLPAARVDLARLELGLDQPERALQSLQPPLPATDPRASEAGYLRGAALHLLNRTAEGDAAWQAVAASATDTYAAKAAAERERHGPFSRGFEEFLWLPADAYAERPDGTCRPRTEADLPLLTRQSVRYLLRMQRESGVWDDSWYDFGGQDSMPNVYMAVTAIAATALLAWRTVDPTGVDRALQRAEAWMADESHIAEDDEDEITWAHVYRIQYHSEALARERGAKDAHVAELRKLAGKLSALQQAPGIWRHEYSNPFVSASVLEALARAERAGVQIERKVIDRGLAAMLRTRNDKGAFSYGFPERGGTSVAAAAGRMPLCELGLLLWGASDQDKLGAALDAALKHHANLEDTRKYDNHANRLAYGGFFFWYDMHGRALALQRVADTAARGRGLTALRQGVCAISEIDGTFVDSHELGKPYGTAMALLCLDLAR